MNQINNYLDLSPRRAGSSSPINFQRAPTPGLDSFTPKPYTPTTQPSQYQTNSPSTAEQQQQQQQQVYKRSETLRIQRKRRQDDDRSFHEDELDESSLSEPPSETEPPIEPPPKRPKTKKITKKSTSRQSIPSDRLKPTELIEKHDLEPPTESVPPAKPALTESNQLSKLTFKRKQANQKRNKTNPPSSSKPKTSPKSEPPPKIPTIAPEVQEELETTENQDPNPAKSNHPSPNDQSAEPTPSNSEPKQQQRPEPIQDPATPNSTRTTKTTSTSHPHKKPSSSQTTTKKPVKPSFKKINKSTNASSSSSSTAFPLPSTTSATLTPKPSTAPLNPPRKKAGEYDLNDPTTWGALFGGGDKKPAAKPVKPGNLPPQASLSYNGSVGDRLEARKKQRAEEKRILQQQTKIGFDLLRQNIDMMDFEIEYKNHVRVMVDQPLSPDHTRQSTEPVEPPSSHHPHPNQTGAKGAGISHQPPTKVLCRPDGYKRYLNPPSSCLPGPANSLSHQPPGPLYSSSFPAHLTRKTLPRPGMFGSSFFIWQSHHLP